MSMDEDAMFKALLKNKPQPKQSAAGEIREEPARPPAVRPPAVKGSEDAMYRALLHNKPAPKPQVKAQPVQPVPQDAVVKQEPVVITQPSPPPEMDFAPVVNSINDLKASMNQIHNLLKTMVLPVLVLILIVGIVVLIKT